MTSLTAAPAIWFRRHPGEAGTCRLGGRPALPADIPWPRQRRVRTPLHFLAQIDLSRLPATPLAGAADGAALPRSGFLFFFADMVEEMLWGDNGGPFATTRVIFTDRSGPERAPPNDIPEILHPFGETNSEYTKGNVEFTQAALTPYVIDTFAGMVPFPSSNDSDEGVAQDATVASIGKALGAPLPFFTGPDSWKAIDAANPPEYVHELHFQSGVVRRELHCPLHQMLGYAKDIQDSATEAQAQGLILLLQIDSDSAVDAQFEFCDGGAAQFWIRPDDLAAQRFDMAFATTEGG